MTPPARWIAHWLLASSLVLLFAQASIGALGTDAGLRAGAYAIDITPTNYPVIVNGMFEERTATNAHDRLHARCLVLDDGHERVAIQVVDSCMMPRELLDRAKTLASNATGIPADHILISATHTHSAPSAMGCLGSRADSGYALYLPGRLAEGIERAANKLVPARCGWGVLDDSNHTFCRRWIRRPDRLLKDPFGQENVRANMHPGYLSPDAIGPSGPVDPALSVLAVQTADGKPLALLANYSMHYFGSPLLSADYFGVFATKVAKLIGAEGGESSFVGIMSQGTSGDQACMDYGHTQKQTSLEDYAQALAEEAAQLYRRIEYHSTAPLAMRQAEVRLGFRVPDAERLAWAREVVTKMKGPLPQTMAEIYALEAIHLHERPTADLILQAVRIGDLGLTAIPNEVFAITGLKIKAQSPLTPTFNIELANGAEGYIPPAEQHALGGYTTWPARTAGLETNAESRIVETSLRLLEQVAGRPRRRISSGQSAYAQAILAAKPLAYWPLNEFNGPTAGDAGEHQQSAEYESGIALYLEGPIAPAFSGGQIHRAAHFAGGRLKTRVRGLGQIYSVSLWFWNGLPNDARPVTGYLFSRGSDRAEGAPGDHLGLGGVDGRREGRLIFYNGNRLANVLEGNTVIEPKTWNHVVLVREGEKVSAYLNGNAQPELSDDVPVSIARDLDQVFIGGRNDNFANFQGKIDEVALFDRALSSAEAVSEFHTSGMPAKPSAPPPAASRLSSPAKSPTESLALLHVPDGFEIELVAAEPLVSSPVAIDWGLDGKLWVVEMADYPMGIDGKMKPGGRVRVLEDTDGDGRYDKSTVFLDGLNFPNGVITWRQGVIVTAAPDIFFAADKSGTGCADSREVLFTGFKEGNLQLRVNGLRWGLDNWLHCANGWSGGHPRSLKSGVAVALDGRDLRIQPDRGWIETESGQSEYGRNCDDWGDWFGCDNSYPLFHFVLEERYLRRNSYVAAPTAKHQAYLPANPKVYPRSIGQKRYHSFDQAGHFTSACSTDFYRDEVLFPRGDQAHVFTCEPVHNLVQHLLVTEEGTTFGARRAEAENEPEFLASEDQWFRPVMARMGPDGALWVVDMYRYMIEHPDWLPPEGRKELEPFYREGANRGRIYRIVKKGQSTLAAQTVTPRLDQLDTAGLVATLERSNGWLRDKAQQALIWRGDRTAVPLLEKLCTQSPKPLTRLQALCTLDGLGVLSPVAVQRALGDPSPGVRRHALRLAEPLAGSSPELVVTAAKLVDDPDAKIRLQLACSLGEWTNALAGQTLARLALANAADHYISAAVVSSSVGHLDPLVQGLVTAGGTALETFDLPLLSLSLALHRRDLAARLLDPILTPQTGAFSARQMAAFGQFLDLLSRRGGSIPKLVEGADDTLNKQLRQASELFAAARHAAFDSRLPPTDRAAAVDLIARDSSHRAEEVTRLSSLLDPSIPGDLQAAAVKALAAAGTDQIPGILTRGWSAHGPQLRAEVLEALLSREAWALDLLGQVENGHIALVDVDAAHRDRMLKNPNENVRARAGKVLASASNSDRQRVVESYRPALALTGDPARGKAVFGRLCVTCHLLDDVGREIGPNLLSVKAHPPEKLLASILDPSREVEPRYLTYNCTLNGGEELYGLIASETGNGVVLKLVDGSTREVLRSDIQALRSGQRSLMPDGLETGLSQQDLADLIRYLKAQPGID